MTAGESPKDSIAAFAEVQAALSDPFGDRDVTLALRGFDERSWQSIEAVWTARLARNDDAAAELARAHGEAFEAARRAPGKGREKEVSLAVAMAGATASPERSPPEMVAPSATAPTPGYTGTAAVDLAAIFKSAVPFDPSARESVPPSPAGAAIKAHLPAQARSESRDTAPPREAGRPPSPPSKSALSGETADVDIGAIARQVLSFGAARPGSAPSRTATPQASSMAVAPPEAASGRVVIRPAGAAAPSPNPTFTLDHYAQLSAEIALDADPAARAAVFTRYGVFSADALTTEWRARFSADPALAGRWSAAYAHHYARLMAERGPRR